MLWNLHTGAKVPPQSIQGTCDHPSTTSRPLYTPSALILYTQRVPTTFRPFGPEVMGTSTYSPCFSRLAISLSKATFQRAACRRIIASLKVFEICFLFSLPKSFLARWWQHTRILHYDCRSPPGVRCPSYNTVVPVLTHLNAVVCPPQKAPPKLLCCCCGLPRNV